MCLTASEPWSVCATVHHLYLGRGQRKAGSPCSAIMILAAVRKQIEDGRKDFKVTKYSCSLLIWLTQKGKNEELTPVGNHDRTLQRRQPKAMAHTPANYSCGYRQQHNSQPVNAQTRINISDIT